MEYNNLLIQMEPQNPRTEVSRSRCQPFTGLPEPHRSRPPGRCGQRPEGSAGTRLSQTASAPRTGTPRGRVRTTALWKTSPLAPRHRRGVGRPQPGRGARGGTRAPAPPAVPGAQAVLPAPIAWGEVREDGATVPGTADSVPCPASRTGPTWGRFRPAPPPPGWGAAGSPVFYRRAPWGARWTQTPVAGGGGTFLGTLTMPSFLTLTQFPTFSQSGGEVSTANHVSQ